jgi:hypothetical protein
VQHQPLPVDRLGKAPAKFARGEAVAALVQGRLQGLYVEIYT